TPFPRAQQARRFRMHGILRSINQAVKGLATEIPRLATTKELLAQNPRLSEDGSWQRMPSYNNSVDILSKLGYNPKKHPDACLFVRNVAAEGRGFEFAMFYNASSPLMVALLRTLFLPPSASSDVDSRFDPDSCMGGAVAAILDHTFASCGICASGFVVTANLSVNYKSPIPLGSVVLVETKVEKVEEKKIFLSGCVRSTNARILHAEATGESTCGIQLDPPIGSPTWGNTLGRGLLLLSSLLWKEE
uniref:Acyl-coenzyme A thioesterase THEM4 n=1 Tax=Pseudonaja textilis TaxID=8673 RepID=A0A670Z448_PSETE